MKRKEPTQQTRDIELMLFQCWPAVYDIGPTLNQHLFNVSCLLGIAYNTCSIAIYYQWAVQRHTQKLKICRQR